MACWRNNQKRGGLLGKKVSPRDFPEPEGGYRDFKIGNLFAIKKGKRLTKADMIPGDIIFIGATDSNNGKTASIANNSHLHPANTITVTYNGSVGNAFYQMSPFWASDDVNVLYPKFNMDEHIALYLLAPLTKQGKQYAYSYKWTKEKMESDTILLPTNASHQIDFEFMRERVRELEEERVRELEAYLKVTGLDDCTLSQSEKDALSLFSQNKTEMGLFSILDLYEKVQLKNKDFDKRKDTSPLPSEIFSVPLVNAKHGNNGIMFYGKKEIFPSEEMTIDIVQNGAVATGDVYAQPHKTGILWDAYLIKATKHLDTENTLLFMACAIQKTIKLRFNYDEKAVWDRVKRQSIFLPVKKSGDVDFELMENYIRAVKKECIARLKAEINRERKVYREVIDE